MRAQVLRLVSLPLWHALSRGRLQLELHDQPQLARHWKHLAKREAKAAAAGGDHVPVQQRPEATFVPGAPALGALGCAGGGLPCSAACATAPCTCRRVLPTGGAPHLLTPTPPHPPSPALVSEFLEVLSAVVPEPMDAEGGGGGDEAPAKLDRQALLFCERSVEFLTDLLSQVAGLQGWRGWGAAAAARAAHLAATAAACRCHCCCRWAHRPACSQP